jgi:hypothetical protein
MTGFSATIARPSGQLKRDVAAACRVFGYVIVARRQYYLRSISPCAVPRARALEGRAQRDG